MKTKNNIQNTVLKSLAVIASFIVISLTVSAQDLWKSFIENETFNEIALAMVDKNIESKTKSTKVSPLTETNLFTSNVKLEPEETLELESWMTNEALFNYPQKQVKKKISWTEKFIYHELKDPRLVLENWMFNSKYWRIGIKE